MTCGYRLVLLAAAAFTCAGMSSSVADNLGQSSQDRSAAEPAIKLAQTNTQNQQKKPPPARAVTPAAPAHTVAPRNIAPTVAPKVTGPTVAPKVVGPALGPKVVSPTANPNFVPRNKSGQRTFAPGRNAVGPGGNAARAVAIRGASRTTIAGRNFSIRRGSYRTYRGGHWRTFVGLSALGAVMFGTALYYPYAYIDAPPDLCDGFTEDGCQLQWQEVQTLEGPPDFQCVAYCPWQQ